MVKDCLISIVMSLLLALLAFWLIASPFVCWRSHKEAQFWREAYMRLSSKVTDYHIECMGKLTESFIGKSNRIENQVFKPLYEQPDGIVVITNSFDNNVYTSRLSTAYGIGLCCDGRTE